ncbi:hypothetical protein LCGC14_2805860, partial [marine sediment metagenome]
IFPAYLQGGLIFIKLQQHTIAIVVKSAQHLSVYVDCGARI